MAVPGGTAGGPRPSRQCTSNQFAPGVAPTGANCTSNHMSSWQGWTAGLAGHFFNLHKAACVDPKCTAVLTADVSCDQVYT
jgi:hypothetical protein